MARVFGGDRSAVVARELTKLHETILSAPLSRLMEVVAKDAYQQKGEFVIIVAGAERPTGDRLDPETQRLLRILSEELPLKQAAALAAKITGEKKNRLYKAALAFAAG
jgi:16S rRNA (cytidine1402-2'-O)-methyltransferase